MRGWDASGDIGVVKAEIPTIREAVAKYLADAEARQLAPESIKKLRHTTEKLLLGYCSGEGLRYLKQLDLDRLREFRGTWTYSATAARKRLETVRAFFRFCVQSGWIQSNPAALIRSPKSKHSPTLPFTPEHVTAILSAADRFWDRGIFGKGNRKRIRALVLLLRYSGAANHDQVSILLGHSSVRITEKHYSPWVKARQEQLDAAVKKTWS